MDSGVSAADLEVFNGISELKADPQLIQGNMDFYEKNADIFDANEEENKLEYMTIYEEYLSINDDVIQSKLKEKFPEEQCVHFLSTFKDNLKAYEQIDEMTVSYLFELIDFQKFKKRMCDAKKMQSQDDGSKTMFFSDMQAIKDRQSINFEEDKKFFAEQEAEYQSGSKAFKRNLVQKEWKNNYKILLHQRKMPDSNVDLFRTEVRYRGVTLEQIHQQLVSAPPKDKSPITTFEIIEEDAKAAGEEQFVNYHVWKMPTLTIRDCVGQCYSKLDNDTYFYCMRPIDHETYPEKKGTIRMLFYQNYQAKNIVEDGVPVVHIIYYSRLDLKGYCPASLINLGASNGIHQQFKNWAAISTY